MVRDPNVPPFVAESAPSTDDTLAFLFRDAGRAGDLGQDPSAPAVLEVVQVWEDTVLEVRHLAPGKPALTIGGDPKATFAAPDADAPGGRAPLFQAIDGGFRACLRDGWEGFVQDAAGDRTAFSALRAGGEALDERLVSIAIPEGATVWIDVGHVVFAARHVPPGRRAPVGWRDRVDLPFLGLTSFVGFAAAMLGLVILTAPPPVETQAIDGMPERIAMVLQTPPPVTMPVEKPRPEVTNQAEGARAKRAEGRSGDRKSKMKDAKGARLAMERAREEREFVENSGLLGAMRDEGVAAMMGDGALAAGMFDTIGSKYASARGNRMGVGGLGDRGDGLGGGGEAAGSGGTGTRGIGGGDGRYGEEGGTWGKKEAGNVGRLSGEVITLGSLDKSLIDAVIKRHMSAIRYCYQRELSKDPGLGGKVSVKFVIAGDGSVSKASIPRSSLGSSAVESCMTSRFLQMKFPEPKGNGIVIVTYPFLFSAG